jgi:hypothetical protein
MTAILGNLDVSLLYFLVLYALLLIPAFWVRFPSWSGLLSELAVVSSLPILGHLADWMLGLYSTAPIKDPIRNLVFVLLIGRGVFLHVAPAFVESRSHLVKGLAASVISLLALNVKKEREADK